jgi:site-specific DNA recombinase
MSREDAGGLLAVPDARVDMAAPREEAAAIRWNLEEMAADRTLGLISRTGMLAATRPGTIRQEQIALIAEPSRENVVASMVAASDVAAEWAEMDQSRQRAAIKTLMTISVHSPGRGARREFDPATEEITWRHEDQAS